MTNTPLHRNQYPTPHCQLRHSTWFHQPLPLQQNLSKVLFGEKQGNIAASCLPQSTDIKLSPGESLPTLTSASIATECAYLEAFLKHKHVGRMRQTFSKHENVSILHFSKKTVKFNII